MTLFTTLRKLRTWYKVHKWLAIVTGVAILAWLLSGILMVLPSFAPGIIAEETLIPQRAPAWDELTLSPAAAVAVLPPDAGVTAVSLQPVGADLVYSLQLADGTHRLLDAASGAPLDLNADTAADIINHAFALPAPVKRVDYVERHTLPYLYGDLPAYCVILDDDAGRHIHVAANSGQIWATNRTARIFLFFEAVHTFAIFGILFAGETAVSLLLWLTIALSLLAVLVGGYLALPHRRRGSSRSGRTDLTGWLRRLRSWYTLHRWLSILTGLALAMWLVTGITMTWRHVFPTPPPAAAPVAYADMTASPAAAAAAAAEISGDVAPVRQISLTPLPGRLAYTVTLANGWQFLIDAATAQQVEMTDDLVTGLAQQLTGFTATPTITRITDHSPRYPYGPVPVLQAAFADARQTHVYVVPFSGQSWTNTRGDRLRTLLGSLHTLDALRIVVKSDNARTLLLITAALFTLLTALTGYYLALPNRWQWLTRRSQKEKSAPNDAGSPKTHLTQ